MFMYTQNLRIGPHSEREKERLLEKIKMRPYWIGVGPNPQDRCPINVERKHGDTVKEKLGDNGGRGDSTAISQVLLAVGRSWRRQEGSFMKHLLP